MREIPILFSAEMVRAILEERKSETRRIIKPQPTEVDRSLSVWRPRKDVEYYFLSKEKKSIQSAFDPQYYSPYGWKGDRLWVRETWREAMSETDTCYAYRADNSYQCGKQAPDNCNATWKPSIHMPKAACRLWLEVTDVRVERLQSITEEGAISEGIDFKAQDNSIFYRVYGKSDMWQDDPIWSFRSLWESIHGVGSWDLNCYVWVVSFKKVLTHSIDHKDPRVFL